MNDIVKTNKISSFSEILSNLNIFDNSLKDLQYNSLAPKSAVAIIVKKNEQEENGFNRQTFGHDQILFLQRKKSVKDKFSGEICFPGGMQQKNQNLFEAVIRETFQQTNIVLEQKYLIGCLNRKVNLILSTKKQDKDKKLTTKNESSHQSNTKKQMVVYAFIFVISEKQITSQIIKLNKDEMQSYKWVKTNDLMRKQNICWLDYSERLKGVLKHQKYQQVKNIKSQNTIIHSFPCVNRVLSPALEIGMNEKLYGVTLYVTLIVLSSLLKSLQEIQQKLSQQKFSENKRQMKSLIHSLQQIKQRCQSHVVFEINQPIDENFIEFQKNLLQGIYSLRPKL